MLYAVFAQYLLRKLEYLWLSKTMTAMVLYLAQCISRFFRRIANVPPLVWSAPLFLSLYGCNVFVTLADNSCCWVCRLADIVYNETVERCLCVPGANWIRPDDMRRRPRAQVPRRPGKTPWKTFICQSTDGNGCIIMLPVAQGLPVRPDATTNSGLTDRKLSG